MQALQYAEYGGPEVLRLVDVPLAEPGPGQVRVAVRAAGVNPRDAKLRGGRFASEPLAHPAGLGMELSGVVDAVGDGVDVWRVGQPVFGRSVTRDAVATHALVPADDLVAKPDRLTHTQAAALPIAVETAYRGLRQLGVGPGATLLIHGASGGVGLVATQLALIEGLTVVATVATAYRLLHGDGDVDTAHHLLTTALRERPTPPHDTDGDLVRVEALHTLTMICFAGGRAELWPPLHRALDALPPPVPAELTLPARTLSDPARHTPQTLALADTAVTGLGHEVSPARIVRTAMAVAPLDRLSACREVLRRVVRHGREGGAVTSAIEALFLLAQDAFDTGRWDEARQLSDEGLELCRTHGYDLLSWSGRLTSALLAAARGDFEAAADTARDMDAWAAPRRAGIVNSYASHVRSLTALGRGEFDTAFRNASALSPAGTFAPYAPHALPVFHDLVEAAVHTGRDAEARAHLAAARGHHLDRLSPRLRLIVLAGEALTAPGTSAGSAESALEAAIKDPSTGQHPFDPARVQLGHGSHLRRLKRIAEARRHLDAAAEIFRGLGATPWTARAGHELRATGITVSTTADSGLAALTPQQRQIAQLAAAGHTNKEIAARLFLSPRTVAAHLYQVFPKLGITSRAALRDALGSGTSE